MLTDEQFNNATNDLLAELEKCNLKAGVVYSITAGEDSLLNGVKNIVFKVNILDNAMYPHLEVECVKGDSSIVGKLGFTKTEYFTTEPAKDQKFGFNMMYDISELDKLKNELNPTVNAEFYISQRDQLSKMLDEVNLIIKDNGLEAK